MTLNANGGATEGRLYDSTAPGSFTLPVTDFPDGSSQATFAGVHFTGVSAPEIRDVILTAPFLTLTGASEPFAVRDLIVRLAVEKNVLLSGGQDTALLTATLQRSDGLEVADEPVTFETDQGSFEIDGVTVASPAVVMTNESGLAFITLRSSDRVAAAAERPDERRGVHDDAPGDQCRWLENGRTYTARVRAIGIGIIGPVSNPTTFTPQGPVPPEADITPEVPEESITVTPTERGTALLTFAFILGNDGANTLFQVWLDPRNLPVGGVIVAGDSWHWTGIAVPPGGSATAYVTVEVEAD